MTSEPDRAGHGRRLEGPLLTECGEWIWEQLSEDGMHLAGELIDLILETERELGIQGRHLPEIAQVLSDEFALRGLATSPRALEPALILAVLEWEDEFLGLAGIPRGES